MSRRTIPSGQLSLFATAPPRYPRPEPLVALGRTHAVVEASAGTGKTYLLEHLVIDLLLSHGAKLEEILVVTFTEKATAELIQRVRAKLLELSELRSNHPKPTDLHWVIDDKARAILREALHSFDRANIFTIHGFCQRLLRDHAFFHHRLFDEQPMDGGEAWHTAFTTTLRAHVAADAQLGPYLQAWLAQGHRLDSLEKLLLAGHEHLSGLSPERPDSLRPRFDESAVRAALGTWDRNAVEDGDLLAKLKRAGVHHKSLDKVVRLLAEVNGAVAQPDLAAVLAALPRGENGTDYLLRTLSPFTNDREIGDLATRMCALAINVPPLHAALIQRVLPIVRTQLAAYKQQGGVYDFQDMLTEVARSLSDPESAAPLLDTLRARFRYALIDEFQDTDEVQWGIFRRIFFDSPHHVLTVIGDPKQAIYAFRGADVATYLDARQTIKKASGACVQLRKNFRSSAPVVDGYNTILSSFFRDGGGIDYTDVECGCSERRLVDDKGEDVPGLIVLDVPARGPKLKAAQARAAVQTQIVSEIRRLKSERPLFVRKGDKQRPLQERDIFILTFTNSESHQIGEVLRAAGIRIAFFKQDGLFQSREAQDVLAVLRALDRPHDRGCRARALLSAFFELSLPDLAACGELEPHQPPLRVLEEWRRLAMHEDLATLFSRMLDDSGISCRLLFQGGGERALTNVQHVLEVLQSEASHTHCTFRELVAKLSAWVNRRRPPPGHDGNMQRLETDADAVQIMTVHKAKGLEAEVVFVYGGTGKRDHSGLAVMHDDGQRVAYAGDVPVAQQTDWENEQQDEQRRVLYVALTRACSRLYLPHHPVEFAHLDGPYKLLNDRLNDLRENLHLTWVTCGADTDRLAPANDVAAWVPPVLPPAVSDGEFAPIRHQRAGFLITSYTAVKSKHGGFVPAEQTGDHAAANEPIAPVAAGSDDELPRGRQSGIFLHALLEELPLAPLAQGMAFDAWYDESRADLDRIARQQAWDRRWLPAAARLVHTTLTTPVELGGVHLRALAGVDKALRECEFLYPIPEADHPLLGRGSPPGQRWTVERGLVKGFMDFLFEVQGRIFVCDWKGDSLPAWDADSVRGHCERNYEIQARLYALAVLRMAGIDGPERFDERFGGVLYCFLRGRRSDDPTRGLYFRRPDWTALLAWQNDMLGSEFWGLS